MSIVTLTDQPFESKDFLTKFLSILGSISAAYSKLRISVRRRRKLRGYLDFSDRMLTDIGVTREEINWALRLPIHENAALELEKRAKARRQKNPNP